MSGNAERMAEDLRGLGYDPVLFSTPKGDGVKFEYRIGDGSREGEVVMLGMAMRDRDGEWPEIPPHWVLVSPPDEALEALVKGAAKPGVARRHDEEDGTAWLIISAPPNDFWDGIEAVNGKCMETYMTRHVRRLWRQI